MSDFATVIRLGVADPTIPWPERGSAETTLCYREGWELRTIPTVSDGVATTVEAMCFRFGELAVNHMMGGDEGFAICVADTGYRISCDGGVFARCVDAMVAAEAMMAGAANWGSVQARGFTDNQRRVGAAIFDAATRRGEILLDRIYPTRAS